VQAVVQAVVVAHRQQEEVPGLALLGSLLPPFTRRLHLLRLVRVVAGGLMEVAISGVDVEVSQLRDIGVGVGGTRRHEARDVGVDMDSRLASLRPLLGTLKKWSPAMFLRQWSPCCWRK
jgi:hypothetical protein